MTLADVNQVYRFPVNESRYTPRAFQENLFWMEITSETRFSPNNARASSISNLCIQYVHRILANTIFGKGDRDGMVHQTELLILWSMLYDFRINISFYIVKQFTKVACTTRGAIVLGGLITLIVLTLDIDIFGMRHSTGGTHINIDACIVIRMIARQENGDCLLFKNSSHTIPLPNS